jgi:hypothetical protein
LAPCPASGTVWNPQWEIQKQKAKDLVLQRPLCERLRTTIHVSGSWQGGILFYSGTLGTRVWAALGGGTYMRLSTEGSTTVVARDWDKGCIRETWGCLFLYICAILKITE